MLASAEVAVDRAVEGVSQLPSIPKDHPWFGTNIDAQSPFDLDRLNATLNTTLAKVKDLASQMKQVSELIGDDRAPSVSTDQLIEIATELAMDAKDDVADLQRKLSAIETAKVEIESRLHIANHALERLSSFVSMRGSDLQCPRCWITSEVIASLQLSNGNGDHDKFRCEICKSIFDLQI